LGLYHMWTWVGSIHGLGGVGFGHKIFHFRRVGSVPLSKNVKQMQFAVVLLIYSFTFASALMQWM